MPFGIILITMKEYAQESNGNAWNLLENIGS